MDILRKTIKKLSEAEKEFEEALKNADSLNDIKMRIKLDSKRASTEGLNAKSDDAVTLRII